MKKKSPLSSKGETYGIYGYCDFDMEGHGGMGPAVQNTQGSTLKRLILKTDNDQANDLSVKLRRSVLKRCQNLRIRTDIQAEGLYFVKSWLLKLIPQFEAHLSKSKEEDSVDGIGSREADRFEFTSFSDDFLPFIAKNQFKKQVRKFAPMPKKDSAQEKIAQIMNPMEMTLTKDHVKVLLHIVPKTRAEKEDFLLLPPITTKEH